MKKINFTIVHEFSSHVYLNSAIFSKEKKLIIIQIAFMMPDNLPCIKLYLLGEKFLQIMAKRQKLLDT